MGVTFDSHLSFDKHIDNFCHACYFYIRRLRHVHSAMLADTTKIIVCIVVSSRLDYCNGTTRRHVRIHPGQTSMCPKYPRPLVTELRRRNHITPALKKLHWLPIPARITFKVVTVVYYLRERQQPPYLADLISDYIRMRTLRSSTETLLAEQSFRTNISCRSCRYVATKTWNNIPDDIKIVDSLGLFQNGLKTFLFRQSYCC